mmetsp:Transcript_62229/g.140742  ORF Transcript_62229/g.140742 Transcript_62229/m.140742 type:complete len:241 (-) Transcript_62229:167-889(-)
MTMRLLVSGLLVSWFAFAASSGSVEEPDFPTFPFRFSARVEITAHLVDRSKPYPPWLRVIQVSYDYPAKKALAVVEQGYDEGKTFLRRYDNKSEYMVRGGRYAECQRSYLGETMPPPVLPHGLEFVGFETVEGFETEHWMEDFGVSRVHVYIKIRSEAEDRSRWPWRVTDEQVLEGVSVPLMTTEWKDFTVLSSLTDQSAPSSEDWAKLFDIPEPYDYRSCTRNIGGFPYMHIFHHYLRF